MTIGPRSHPSRREFVVAGLAAAAGSALPASAQSRDLTGLTLKQASDLVRRKDVSPVELAEACLARIDRHDRALNAFITVTREQALVTAREMEAELRRGARRGPLHGIPIVLKDNIDTAGILTTAASGVFKDRVPTEDADVVVRLKKAGAVLLGKANLHEFALGGTSAVSHYGPVHNPWALDRVAGGSSGGSAAAVAADLCFGALGTDTGGSIRIPASLCGIVGFKPTYGRVSTRGVVPMAWTLDHVGPMCKTVEDAALMLAAIAGYDALDPTSVDVPVADYSRAIRLETSKLRVGVARMPFFDNLDPEVGTGDRSRARRPAQADGQRRRCAGASGGKYRRPLECGDLRVPCPVDYEDARAVPASDAQSDSGDGQGQSGDLRACPTPGGRRASRDPEGVCDRRFAHHADAARCRATDRGGSAREGRVGALSTPRPSISMACRRFRFPAASPGRDCQSACKSAVTTSRSRRC